MLVFAAAVLAAAAGLANAANSLDTRSSQAAQARIGVALAFIDEWNAPALYQCKKCGRDVISVFEKNHRIEAQDAYLENNPEQRANLIDPLNHFEALSIAITKGAADEETAKQFFASIVLKYWHTTEGYVRKRRAERSNARLFREFETLYERWKN